MVEAWQRTAFSTIAPNGVAGKSPIFSKRIPSGLWKRFVWATIEPYFWNTPPQAWAVDLAVRFTFENQETGLLPISLSNQVISSTQKTAFHSLSTLGGGEQPALVFRPLDTLTAGYSNLIIPCWTVAVEADNAELLFVNQGTATPYDVNAVLSGFRILSQRPV